VVTASGGMLFWAPSMCVQLFDYAQGRLPRVRGFVFGSLVGPVGGRSPLTRRSSDPALEVGCSALSPPRELVPRSKQEKIKSVRCTVMGLQVGSKKEQICANWFCF
jgi:hypothetical protein